LEQKSIELENATAELRAANERLKELDQMKDEFLTTVSHELRTPMTSIRSFAQILSDTPELALRQREEFLGIIVKESERLSRLINQILDLEKLEAGKVEWRVGSVDARAVIEDSQAATKGLLSDRTVNLQLDLPDPLPPVRADRDRLHQVLVNLLSNAVDFCDQREGFVKVEAATESHVLRISVTDNGSGVPEAARESIFDKFHRSFSSESDGVLRTGLGLAICRRIVTQFGGRIWVDDTSHSGMRTGARFSFTVPLATG